MKYPNGVTSEEGSILGPLLFNIHVNDLPDIVNHSTINLYADDTPIYVTGRDPDILSHKLNEDLQKLAEWIEANGLKMNMGKTQLVMLSRKRSQIKANSIKIGLKDQQITPQKS